MNENNEINMEKEEQPLVDFSKTEDGNDKYNEKAEIVKDMFNHRLITYLCFLILGILCLILTPKSGPAGLVLFLAAVFYLLPTAIIKGIYTLHQRIHYKDYVEYRKGDGSYLKIVMNAIRNKDLFGNKIDDSI